MPFVDFSARYRAVASEPPSGADGSPRGGGPSAHSKGLAHRLPPRRRPPARASADSDDRELLPTEMFDRPVSVFVYGPCRPIVNLAVFALAEATSPEFHWIDIGVPGEERVAFDPVQLGWVPGGRLWRVEHPELLHPNDLTANLALFGLVRSDEPPATLLQVTEFLRLPEMSQRILANRPPDGRPGVVAVSNAHRAIAIYTASRVAPLLGVHTAAGFSVLVGYGDAPGPSRMVFDYVFRIDCERPLDWKQGRVICEKGIDSGPLAGGRPMSLSEIPLFAAVLARADRHSTPTS